MIKLDEKVINLGHFPDGTLLIKENISRGYEDERTATISWKYENDGELVALIYLTKHLKEHGIAKIYLNMPYIPNARQDRVKSNEDVFTLKYFAEIINSLGFASVTVLDPHSVVSEALIDRILIKTPAKNIEKVLENIGGDNVLMFYPDEGAMKRYSSMADKPYVFGMKKRDWTTGQINGLDVAGATELISGSRVLIVDDICSRGGTFYHSAKKLKELGAKEIYLYVSHCENTIFEGELLSSGLIEKIYTTDSLITREDERIEVIINE